MPPVSRLGDTGSGHACFPPTVVITCSGNVIAESKGVARITDALVPHSCSGPPHPRQIASGSGTVNANSLKLARIGDSISCGGAMVTGAGTVLAGG